MVVGRLDAVGVGEGPERRPVLQEVLGEEAVVLRLGALARGLLEQRSEFYFELPDPLVQAGAVAVLAVVVPGFEQPPGDLEAGLAELFCAASPSLWAVKSLIRCDQQSWRCSGSR